MRKSIRALVDKSAENILASEELVKLQLYDIASSRIYYAMFYAAEALLLSAGREFSSHGALHAAFGEYFVKTGRIDSKYHRYLIDAFRERQVADYDAPAKVSKKNAETLIRQAKEFSEVIKNLMTRNKH